MPAELIEAPTKLNSRELLLRRFMQMYWLRPENALWMALRSDALSDVPLTTDSADISCGDGIFGFLHAGGVMDPSFDVFGAVSHLDDVTGEHADMFDCVTDDYRPPVVSPPRFRFSVGTDLKETMLAKAEVLRLYDRLVQHDNERPLPFDAETFETVYCNSAYWVNDIDGLLGELRRITRSDGRVVLQVKLESLRDYTLDRFRGVLGDRMLTLLGRGRVETWPSLASRTTWESRFAKADLRIERAQPFVTRTHAHLWDIGLRPLAPLLIKMANGLTADSRRSIKKDWVDLCCELLEPLCHPTIDLFGGASEPAEIQYTLTPG